METVTRIKPLLATRAEGYDLLRRTFITEPTLEFGELVAEYDFANFPFVHESGDIHKGIALICDWKANQASGGKDGASLCEALKSDYVQLFIGPGKLPAPPWESVYRNEERLLFQEETLQVRRAYLKYRFLPVHYRHEADDHLGLELDFMFRLSALTWEKAGSLEAIPGKTGVNAALDPGQVTAFCDLLLDQKHFLEQHLLQWVPALSQDIATAARTDFYRGMAYVLTGFLKLDLEALEELLGIEQWVATGLQ